MELVKKYWIGLLVLILVGIAAVLIYLKLHPKELPANLVAGTGRIDGDLVNLNTKYPGRIVSLNVDDGVPVKNGMLVARLSSKEFEAQKQSLEDQIAAKNKELKAKEIELSINETKIPQLLHKAQAALKAKESQLQELENSIASQRALVEQDRRDLERMQKLYAQKLIEKHKLEEIRLKYDVDHNALQALDDKRKQLLQAIAIAKSDLSDAIAAQKSLDAMREGVAALRKGIAALEASKAQVEAMIEELTLKSPLTGFTVEKIANTGEVIGAGMPVATLVAPESLYLKIFVDTIENGKIKLHDKAEIFLDAWPDRPIPAEVVRIAQKAEFTPKEVSVRSDRIQRVFAVHLKPLKPDPLLKLGLPAIGVISLDGKGLPRSLDELPPL
ncbi:HlyD family secretion protein [Nitratifractor salsuginis]|uniref:Secretion protein HlyD family protein n=1 Tax=Nitratifractor salsuginis (strain DSM 16511 / JCM 12458 / E9I37-1) TaxID=749222 RepID=E6X3C5_NITSE|nr:HlyD family efflux transporter periplasmic adaptor subunit [Nitratifractor salsuginis]ADV47338.1 secretion protein HlyD family protein [Nitratifractor salsuginis DSM 16511]